MARYSSAQVAGHDPGGSAAGELKNNSITAAKIKNGAITGSKVLLSSLGTVPSAAQATTTANATNAAHADSASVADGSRRRKLFAPWVNRDSRPLRLPGKTPGWKPPRRLLQRSRRCGASAGHRVR
jgi:hypothetical protein